MSKLGEFLHRTSILRRPSWLESRSLIVNFCCVTLLAASGCTTMHTVDRPASGTPLPVEAGETVEVSLRDGSRIELSFVEWTADRLAGTDSQGILHRIAAGDIAKLEVKRHSLLRSIGVGVVIVAVVLAAAGGSSDY
jgi:hypothetical protein